MRCITAAKRNNSRLAVPLLAAVGFSCVLGLAGSVSFYNDFVNGR